jgi:hypothetical protein
LNSFEFLSSLRTFLNFLYNGIIAGGSDIY